LILTNLYFYFYFYFYFLIFIIYSNLICCTGGYSWLKPLPGSAFAFFLVFTLTEVAIAFFLQHPALFAAYKLGVKLFFIQFFIILYIKATNTHA